MILIFKHIFRRNYIGLTLWPLIILRNHDLKQDEVLLNHERIHLKQQRELLVIPFYFLYFFEWIYRSIKYRDSYKAYKNISFEREAYQNEFDLTYLENRRTWHFLKYIRQNGPKF